MVRVTRQQALIHRDQILNLAAKLFRERGFDGVSVADVMNGAGLTHGGFYGHFRSKDDLAAQASARAVETMLEDWRRVAATDPGQPLQALVRHYLSDRHRRQTGRGCLMAALGPEVPRQSGAVRKTVTECFGSVLAFIAGLIPERSAAARRKKALATFAGLVGALVIARAVNDPKLSREITEAVADLVL